MTLFYKFLIFALAFVTVKCQGNDIKQQALQAYERHPGMPISKKDYVNTALFVQKKLSKYLAQEKYYIKRYKTGLRYDLEYVPETKSLFIVLDNKKSFLGRGKKKVASKAIQYSPDSPRVVARLRPLVKTNKEIEISKIMKGSPGIFEIYGFGKERRTGQAIYTRLYNPGSLSRCFKSKVKFTIEEKMHIALCLLKGLESLHAKGIVHRDLCTQNCLIDISGDKRGQRSISACIADLGRCDQIKNVTDTRCQGHSLYTSPEGLLAEYLNLGDYKVTDVFATGCILYQLFYGKPPSWQKAAFAKQKRVAADKRYDKFVKKLNKSTHDRHAKIEKKERKGKGSKKKAFEKLILRMLHPDPDGRGSARELKVDLERIIKS